MKITRERLTFEFLQELYREHNLDPLPNHWIPLDVIWQRVTSQYGKRLSSGLASAAFNELYTDHLINQVNHPDGRKEIQINQSGLDAYNATKANFKSEKKEKKEYNLKLLTAIVAVAGLIVLLIKLIFFHQ
jgi:hypothetical protein